MKYILYCSTIMSKWKIGKGQFNGNCTFERRLVITDKYITHYINIYWLLMQISYINIDNIACII